MTDNTTTLSKFTDSGPIRRTVNEYATSYDVHVPEDVFDVSSFSGYVRYALTTHNGEPVLKVTPNPSSDNYAENTLLVTEEDTLPLPRGIIELCAPDNLTNWTQCDSGVIAHLDIPQRDTLPGDQLATGNQALSLQNGEGVVSLPKHPEIADRLACSLQVVYGTEGFELIATLVPPEASARQISEATTLPKTSVPAALVQAIGQETISVTVFDGGPVTTRGTLLDKYPTKYGMTTQGSITVDEANASIPLPDEAISVFCENTVETGVLRVVADDGTLLVVCDSNGADGKREFTAKDSELICDQKFVEWLALSEGDIHWHFHDGTLVGELVATRPGAPKDVRGVIGEFDGREFTIPSIALREAGLSVESDSRCIVTAIGDTIGFVLSENGGTQISVSEGDDQSVAELSMAQYDVLAPEESDVLLCLPTPQSIVCVPISESNARKRVGEAPPEDMADARLHIPEDGKNAFVQQVGEGDPAVGVPSDATEQFNLEEGSKFEIQVGTYNGTLAISCTPISDDEVGPDVCLGRMLSQSNLRLPIQIVATLSLF